MRFLRHTKMAAWGCGVVIAEGEEQLAIAFADGVTRRFKHALVGKLLVEDEPTDEERELLAPKSTEAPEPEVADPPELERELAAAEDPAPYLVYGDLLLARGDARGELIQAQVERDHEREEELLREHRDLLPKSLRTWHASDHDKRDVEWRWGFLASVKLRWLPEHGGAIVAEILAHPAARFLRTLHVDARDGAAAIAAIGEARPPYLRELSIGRSLALAHGMQAGDIAPLFALPELRKLRLGVTSLEVGAAIAHDRLEEVEVDTHEVDAGTIAHLVQLRAPELWTLALHAPCGKPHRKAFVHMPALEHLAIHRTTDTRAWLEHVVAQPFAKNLASLDVQSGDLGDADIDFLLEHRHELPALEELDVSFNAFTKTGAPRLAGYCAEVRRLPFR